MPARLSTGLVNKLMDTGSFKSIFVDCFIDIYSGPQPASADLGATGTKLVTIYSNGVSAGLEFEASATDGELEKNAGETWSGTILADGVAGYFRMREASDNGLSNSSTAARFDGSVATSGGQMNLSGLNFVAGAPFTLPTAKFTLPKA